jgi:DNA polymerase
MDVGHNLDDLTDDDVQEIVNKWRSTNSNIQKLWYEMEESAVHVIQYGGTKQVQCLLLSREFDYAQNTSCLTITLPSQRKLFYISPSLGENRWGNPSITYMGMDQTTKKWKTIETYGGKLTENVVQAIARDCLAEAIEHLEAAGFPIVFHVHDEVVIDIKPFAESKEMLDRVRSIMTSPISWAPGLPLGADGWVGSYFTKD